MSYMEPDVADSTIPEDGASEGNDLDTTSNGDDLPLSVEEDDIPEIDKNDTKVYTKEVVDKMAKKFLAKQARLKEENERLRNSNKNPNDIKYSSDDERPMTRKELLTEMQIEKLSISDKEKEDVRQTLQRFPTMSIQEAANFSLNKPSNGNFIGRSSPIIGEEKTLEDKLVEKFSQNLPENFKPKKS